MMPVIEPRGTVAVPLNGSWADVILSANKRNWRIIVVIAGILAVAGGPAGATRNGGRPSTLLQFTVAENNNNNYGIARGWLLSLLSESYAASPVALTPIPASANLPIGNYSFYEELSIDFGALSQMFPMETGYCEADPKQFFKFRSRINPGGNPITTLVAPNGGATVTIPTLNVSVYQEYTEYANATLPYFKPNYVETDYTITGSNPQLPLYIQTQDRLRRLIIGQETTVAADGGLVVTSDVINSLALIGDGGENLIGPDQALYRDLVQSQRFTSGGDPTFLSAFWIKNFAPFGRLSDTPVPQLQYQNFRALVSAQPSVSVVGTSRVVIGAEGLTRPQPVGGRQVVTSVPPDWISAVGV